MNIQKPSATTALLTVYILFIMTLMGYATAQFTERNHTKPTTCNDIIRYANGDIVCEINLKSEDENIQVFRKG